MGTRRWLNTSRGFGCSVSISMLVLNEVIIKEVGVSVLKVLFSSEFQNWQSSCRGHPNFCQPEASLVSWRMCQIELRCSTQRLNVTYLYRKCFGCCTQKQGRSQNLKFSAIQVSAYIQKLSDLCLGRQIWTWPIEMFWASINLKPINVSATPRAPHPASGW